MHSVFGRYLQTIGRFSVVLVCLCTAQFSRAGPIYIAEAQSALDSWFSAASLREETTAQGPATSDFLPTGTDGAASMNSALYIAAAMLSYAPTVEARFLLAAASASVVERPRDQFQSLIIAGLQYSTGLGFDSNSCNARAAAAACPSISEALFDLASAQPPDY